ncbi:MAG: DMT family transporter [Pseudomonadota bacterium]
MKTASHQPPHKILLGVLLIVATAFTISAQDVVFKLFSSEMTLWQIFALRGCLAVPILLGLGFFHSSSMAVAKAALGRWLLLRSLFITGTFLAFYAAIPFLSLSTVGAANYIAPVFVALLSAYVIKEPVTLLGWVGVFVGFAGVIVLLRPGTDAFSPWAVLPVIGAGFYALAHIITRTKCQAVPLSAIALSQNIVMLIAGAVVSLALVFARPEDALIAGYPYIFDTWSMIDMQDAMALLVLAGFAVVLSMMLAAAYQVAPPAIVSTFEYSYLVFVVIWDVFFFGVALSVWTVIGMSMIALAGLLVLRGQSWK